MTIKHKIIIKSDISELIKVESELRKIFDICKISKRKFNEVYLCLSEAVLNSIIHGNKGDSKKKVFIEIICFNEEMNIAVKDEGTGFDFNNLKDPTEKENIKKEFGRGIYIIKSLSDELEYDHEGKFIKFKISCW